MRTKDTWATSNAKHIEKSLRESYGVGFEMLHPTQRQALREAKVLIILLGQEGPQFAPAIKLAERLLAALPKEEL